MPVVVTSCSFKRYTDISPHISNAYNIRMRTANWWVGPCNSVRDHARVSLLDAVVTAMSFFFVQARIVLQPLVSLIGYLVACSAWIAADRQTDSRTHTQTKYRNPRCACAPRVKNEQRTPRNHANRAHCEEKIAENRKRSRLPAARRLTGTRRERDTKKVRRIMSEYP